MNQNNQTTIQSFQLQRLIDGECSSDDIREMLTAARNQPWQWEQIALALLEDRAWQQQLQTTVDLKGNADTLPELKKLTVDLDEIALGNQDSTSTLPESGKSAAVRLNSSLPPTREIPASTPVRTSTDSSGKSRTRWNWLALAASLLAVAAIGYTSGQFFANRDFSESLAQSPSRPSQLESPSEFDLPTPNTDIRPVSMNPEYRMRLPGNDRHRLQGDVPLYRVKSMDQWAQIGAKMPAGLQLNSQQIENLNSQGIGIEHDVDFLSGNLGEGRVFIVPIRSVRLLPTQ